MLKLQILSYTKIFVAVFIQLMTLAIFGRILMSWFSFGEAGSGRVGRFLYVATEPVLNLARKLPHRVSMFDFSPIIAILGLELLGSLITTGLNSLANF